MFAKSYKPDLERVTLSDGRSVPDLAQLNKDRSEAWKALSPDELLHWKQKAERVRSEEKRGEEQVKSGEEKPGEEQVKSGDEILRIRSVTVPRRPAFAHDRLSKAQKLHSYFAQILKTVQKETGHVAFIVHGGVGSGGQLSVRW